MFKDEKKLKTTIELNLLKHRKEITTDAEAAESDFKAGNYFKAG